MCGIFGYIGEKNRAAQLVFEGLKSLEYRGYDSWGVAVIPNSKLTIDNLQQSIVIKKQIGKIGTASVNDLPNGHISIGHTRWATHGGVTVANAHPHTDCTKTLGLIHNGIIENYAELKQKLLIQGHVFISETDTEVAVHLIEEYAKKQPLDEAVRMAFNDFHGLSAIIILSTKTQELIAVRNGSPLIIGHGKNENYLASDVQALIPYTRRVYFLRDNEL
ncbi:MAG: glutamine--fructose-6-phosphate transaminase (isomerizing), partial [Patescibacteria group bacterium]